MRTPQTANYPNNLFPMLAVLVGMIGALIVLLLGVTKLAQRTRDRDATAARLAALTLAAKSPSESELPKREFPAMPPELPPFSLPEIEEIALPAMPKLKDRRAEIESRIRSLQSEIEKFSANDRTVEEIARLKNEADRRAAVASAAAESHRKAKAETQRQIALLRDERDALEKRIRQRRLETQVVENRFAVVPYVGPSGTRRRPIYLECRADAVILQPERIPIPADLIRRASPQAVVRAVLEAAISHMPSTNADERPYPLLLVRPAGIAGFYIVRQAILELKHDCGFELADERTTFEFGTPNTQLADAVKAALERLQPASVDGLLASGGADNGSGAGPDSGRSIASSPRGAGAQAESSRSARSNSSASLGNLSGLTTPIRGSIGDRRQLATGSDMPVASRSDESFGIGNGGSGFRSDGKQNSPTIAAAIPKAESSGEGRILQLSPTGAVLRQTNSDAESGLHSPRQGEQRESAGDVPDKKVSAGSVAKTQQPRPFDSPSHSNSPSTPSQKSNSSALKSATDQPEPPSATFEQLFAMETKSDRPALDPETSAGRSDPAAIGVGFDRRPLRKEIHVLCRADALIVYPSQTRITMAPNASVAETRAALADEVRSMRVLWGSPGPLFRWDPVLVFHLAPDGVENYYRLCLGWRNPPAKTERSLQVAVSADGMPAWR